MTLVFVSSTYSRNDFDKVKHAILLFLTERRKHQQVEQVECEFVLVYFGSCTAMEDRLMFYMFRTVHAPALGHCRGPLSRLLSLCVKTRTCVTIFVSFKLLVAVCLQASMWLCEPRWCKPLIG